MVKKDRLEKWYKMVSYGLDLDLVLKVTSKKDHGKVTQFNPENNQPIEFTAYAYIGLQNFFNTNPEMFLSRLAKGPPPQYRWLVWRFIASKLKQRIPGEY